MSKEGNIQSMDQLKMRCPSCNAYIIIKEGNNKCPYCGRELYVENKPDKIEINTIYNVGSDDGSSKSKKKLGIGAIVGIIIVVMVIINLIAGFALIPFITMHNANVSVNDIINNVSKSTYTARTSVRSQLLQKFCEVAFEKPFSQVTSSDYDRIKSIDIGSYSYDDHTIIIKYILDDLDIEREFYCDADIYDIDDMDADIDIADIGCFTNLESFRCSSSPNIYRDTYADTAANLQNLESLISFSTMSQRLGDITKDFFASNQSIEELAISISEQKDIDDVVDRFCDIKELTIELEDADNSKYKLSSLSKLKNLQSLTMPATDDMSFLSTLSSLRSLTIYDADDVRDFDVLYGMTDLTSLTIEDAAKLRNIDFLENYDNLQSLTIIGSGIKDIEAIRDKTSITSLTIKDNDDIEDFSPISTLTSLTSLSIYKYGFSADERIFSIDMRDLTSLSDLSISSLNIDNIQSMPSLTKLSLRIEETQTMIKNGDSFDLSKLASFPSIEELYITGDGRFTNAASLSNCTKLNKIMICDASSATKLRTSGIDMAEFFSLPQLETFICRTKSDLYINIDNIKDNSSIKYYELRIDGDIALLPSKIECDINDIKDIFAKLHSIETLILPDIDLDDISFASDMTSLRLIDISGNDIRDISPLASIDSLDVIYCYDNPISNLEVISDSIKIVK